MAADFVQIMLRKRDSHPKPETKQGNIELALAKHFLQRPLRHDIDALRAKNLRVVHADLDANGAQAWRVRLFAVAARREKGNVVPLLAQQRDNLHEAMIGSAAVHARQSFMNDEDPHRCGRGDAGCSSVVQLAREAVTYCCFLFCTQKNSVTAGAD